ncbi:MAG: PilZ domain-containing protein, partial [Candidatus Omnitrophota bacterium]
RGVGILSEGKIALDKKVEITLAIPDQHEPLNVRGEVVWLRVTEKGAYRVGIKFEKINLVNLSRIFRLGG